jgi:hypothetical protein
MPYRIMVPIEMDGLLVPVAVSATHVGYSAIRMEPAWTALGQAAGIAAALAVREGVEIRRVDVSELQRRLHEAGAFTVYVTDAFPARRMPRPEWDPREPFSAHLAPWPSRSNLSVAVQFFGTRGFFHHFGSEERYRQASGAGRSTGQWGIQYPEHDVELSRPIDAELAARWLQLAGVAPSSRLQADGRLTRGEFILRLYAVAGPAKAREPRAAR